MAIGPRPTGDFCWINMLTAQPAKAREFFAALLGWTYVEIPGMGHRVQVGGRDIGGLFDLEGPNTPPGTPPVIGVMVKVESADGSAAKAATLGGRSMPPFDIMDQGRMAVCFDPDGANIDVWEPRRSPGTEADSDLHGAPSWFEIESGDVARATGFYTAWFGWSPKVVPMPSGAYTMFQLGDAYVAGLMPRAGESRPGWSTYFTVDDADQAARRAVELGGTVPVAVHDVPGVGRSCGITSPQGVPFHVIAYTR